MLSQVATRSVYLDKRAARGMPRQCEVVGVSPLLRQLLILAVDLPSEYDPRSRAGRIMSLLIDEIRLAPALPLSLPFPGDARLANRCRRFIERPTAQDTIDLWSRALGLSRRTFTRLFRQKTGPHFFRLAAASLPAIGRASPAGWRGRDDDRLRPRLFEPGRLHDHVQEAGRHDPPRLSQGGIVSRTGLELAVCRGSR